jgi:hypothetical protein
MFGFRNITTFIAMIALCLGIMEVKNLLNDNFIENDTPVKEALNKFLNGEVPKH